MPCCAAMPCHGGAAQSMLARNRFDPESLVRVVKAVQLRGGGYQPLQPLGETDIEVGRGKQAGHLCFVR